jgi:hypothetical protein
MKVLFTALAAAAAVGLAACGGTSAPASNAATTKPAMTGFGVPECDDYLTKYDACITSKVPEAARAMVRQQLDATKAQWQQAASTPEGKAGLATGCKMALDTARTAMQAYGCTW